MDKKDNNLSQLKEDGEPPGSSDLLEERSFLLAKQTLLSFSSNLWRFYQKNGHASLIKNLKVEVVWQIDRCHQLWQEFTPSQGLFDTWEFRFAFWKGYHHQPYFLMLKNNGDNLALLPLWYEEENQKYFWFGSTWQEENQFFAKDPLFVPLMLAVCPTPVKLNAISLETVLWTKEFIDFKPDEPKYILDLRTIHSLDDYLGTFRKKKRYNLRRDRRIIESYHPQVIFDNFEDFENLVVLSKKRFSEKGEKADWEDIRRVETFRQVINLGKANKSFQVRMITVRIGDKVAGVDLIALFDGCYYPIKCGYDVKNFYGIGNYVNLLEIEDALKLGMKKIDFLEISFGWKERWFEEVPLFCYEKNNGPVAQLPEQLLLKQ